MGVHRAAPSQAAAQIGQEASATGAPQGRRREGKREEAGVAENRERTLSITGAQIDLIIQSIRFGLCSVCWRDEEVGELALGKKGSLIRMREAVSTLSVHGNRTANLGRVSAVISLL